MNRETYGEAVLKASETLCGAYWLSRSHTSARNALWASMDDLGKECLHHWIEQEEERSTEITINLSRSKTETIKIIEPHHPHFPTYDEMMVLREKSGEKYEQGKI